MAKTVYEKGPNAPADAEILWGGNGGTRLVLRGTRDSDKSPGIQIYRSDPLFEVLIQAGVIRAVESPSGGVLIDADGNARVVET